MKVIGLAGMPASGKTTVAEHLVKKYKAHRIYLGDFIWQFLKKRGIKPNEEMGIMAGLYLWVEYGDIPLAEWAIRQVSKAPKNKYYLLDSLRTVEEARIFKHKYGKDFILLGVLASPETRLKREQARARFGKVSEVEFRMRDREELRIGVGDLLATANYYVDANKSQADVRNQTDKIMRQLNK